MSFIFPIDILLMVISWQFLTGTWSWYQLEYSMLMLFQNTMTALMCLVTVRRGKMPSQAYVIEVPLPVVLGWIATGLTVKTPVSNVRKWLHESLL